MPLKQTVDGVGAPANIARCAPEVLWPMRDSVPRVRDELVHRYMGFARGIAFRFRNPRDTVDDVIQVSYLGLVNAVNRYEVERHIPFEAFAAPTIRGELLRHLRDNSVPIHVPRGLQDLARQVERAHSELVAELKRVPDTGEIAAVLAEDRDAVREALGVRDAVVMAGLDPADGGGADGIGVQAGRTDGGFESAEIRASILRAAKVLSRQESLAVGLRFAGDMSQEEIAARLGVSQMTVSRLLRKSLEKMRRELEPPGDPRLN